VYLRSTVLLLPVSSSSSAAIGRTLIPRYFRSIFEGGATDLYYVLKHPKESFHNNFVSLDCDQCTMVTQNGKPMFTQVCVCVCVDYVFPADAIVNMRENPNIKICICNSTE
jgi:hypothetical protein